MNGIKITKESVDTFNANKNVVGITQKEVSEREIEFINVYEDPRALYDWEREEEFTDLEFEEWYDGGGELTFFEGDPDIIKINGIRGYFAYVPRSRKVFYYFDESYGDARAMLETFVECREKVTFGKPLTATLPDDVDTSDEIQSWDVFDGKILTGIAYRGGCGYCYLIQDWTKHAAMNGFA